MTSALEFEIHQNYLFIWLKTRQSNIFLIILSNILFIIA